MERILSGRDPKAKRSQAVVYFPQESTPEIVEAHLRADRNLTSETASALSELFRVAYTQFSRTERRKEFEEATLDQSVNPLYCSSAARRFTSRRKVATV